VFAYRRLIRRVSCSLVRIRTECNVDIVDSINVVLIPAHVSEAGASGIDPRRILEKSNVG
jgi:hypothetical protein